jgi:hypothetical protein
VDTTATFSGLSTSMPRSPHGLEDPRQRVTPLPVPLDQLPTVQRLHEQGNPGHRIRVEHDAHTLLIHLSEDGDGWTTVAVDRETRR